MKYTLIMLENPILVSDEEVKVGDMLYDSAYFGFKKADKLFDYAIPAKAGIPETKKLDLSSLSFSDCEKIGYINIDNIIKLVVGEDYFNKLNKDGSEYKIMVAISEATQRNSNKNFTFEDITKSMEFGSELAHDISCSVQFGRERKLTTDGFVKYITAPKGFDVEIEETEDTIKVIKVL